MQKIHSLRGPVLHLGHFAARLKPRPFKAKEFLAEGVFRSLLAQCDASGLGQLSRAELQEMALLYRQVAADNGIMLGVIGAACHHYDMSLALWSFVAPHGALELPSILIAGGAGFRLGHAMLFPGAMRWRESVARGGVEATRLVSGIIPLLVIAGTLEGFFSPSAAPVWLKFTVGGLLCSCGSSGQ